MKPVAESCLQNQADIYAVLKELLANKNKVLEIGSGTGQHAVYFAERLPHLSWQTSDQESYHSGIRLWLDEANLANTHPPINLQVGQNNWPNRDMGDGKDIDVIYSANVVHIMSWNKVIDYFKQGAKLLDKKGYFVLYGPFNYHGKFTSPSNASFNDWLKSKDIESGVRDFEALDALANENNMRLKSDIEMPANNRILCWQKN